MSAEEAAALIQFNTRIGMSGFTGAGYPKASPMALARRISDANLRGHKSQVSLFTGASTGPELDGALAMAGGIQLRLPYTNPIPRPTSASTLTKWSTWTSTSATSPKMSNTASSAKWIGPS
jgi:acyl-CoA hydrolase